MNLFIQTKTQPFYLLHFLSRCGATKGTAQMATEEGEKLYTTAVHSDSSKTFVFVDEDHTLGNSLRYVIMRDPSTAFCGYTIPHPSENKMHLRDALILNRYPQIRPVHRRRESKTKFR